ncbi:MAG TPA: ECF transporter S component [Clostridiales bacterium]|nr:ECF transporter S component [Clostridiales bacterium]
MNRVLKVLEPLFLILVPLVLGVCAYYSVEYTAILTLGTVIISVVPFFLHFEHKRPRPRDVMPIVVLSSIAAVGRIIFAPFPNVKPVTAIVILSGVCFGKESGFLTGALAALASNMFFGQGPWTPWQMYAWGLIGYLAGAINHSRFLDKLGCVCVFGFIASLMFGFIMDSWYVVGYVSPITLQAALLAYGAGVPFTMAQAVSTVLFLVPIYKPWRKKINRIQRKYGI